MTAGARGKAGRARSGEAASVRTLERGLSVLAALAEAREAPLGVLARRVGLPASTTYRLLETLRQQDFAEWDEASGLFRVGRRAAQVGSAYSAQGALLGAAREPMHALVDELNESANLAALRGSQAVYIAQVEGRQLVRMFTQLGASAPLHCSGVGKVLMAWQDEATVRGALGEGPYPAFTPHSITQPAAYRAELARVRQQGYAHDDQERELGVRCVAAPIRDALGTVVAALSVSAPTSRLTRTDIPRVLAHVQRAAGEISARLGWTE
ncbi:IclR family transcriptional regulator [Deinococcus koreensis]|uniref:IclR family transcriptional regulator n=1 Tax=Deinococcus koreensis TaxID=2054903 RepID=A0A2K3UZA9_9DEIO|nr:IclR family transcriptional regulator [Deinococcus koreensis]PNY81886.1 IclR family transcriptional regulator [Deinococcus koreensis]